MSIDWICIYQPKNAISIGCNPKDFPTTTYIQTSVAFLFPSLRAVAFCWAEGWIWQLGRTMASPHQRIVCYNMKHDNLIGFLAFTIDLLTNSNQLYRTSDRVSSVWVLVLGYISTFPSLKFFQQSDIPLWLSITLFLPPYKFSEFLRPKKQSVFEQISIFGW